MLTQSDAEALAIAASGYRPADEPTKERLTAAGARKRARDAESFDEFRAIDQAVYVGRVRAEVTTAETAVSGARTVLAAAEKRAADALKAERDAQDHMRAFTAHVRATELEYRRVHGKGSPDEQTSALIRMRAATDIAAGEQAKADGAAAERAQADKAVNEARSALVEAEDALTLVRELADHPGRSLYSFETCSANAFHLVRFWDQLNPLEQTFVKQALDAMCVMTGLKDEIRDAAIGETEERLKDMGKMKPWSL